MHRVQMSGEDGVQVPGRCWKGGVPRAQAAKENLSSTVPDALCSFMHVAVCS